MLIAPVFRYLKSLLLLELLRGMRLTGRRLFTRKVTVQHPEEKTPSRRASGDCMPCGATRLK